VLEIGPTSTGKQTSESHVDVNRQSINGQTRSVIVVPQRIKLTTACDCCIRQYWRITHLRRKKLLSGVSDMVSDVSRGRPLKNSTYEMTVIRVLQGYILAIDFMDSI